jgi:hypothetical protein
MIHVNKLAENRKTRADYRLLAAWVNGNVENCLGNMTTQGNISKNEKIRKKTLRSLGCENSESVGIFPDQDRNAIKFPR